MSSPSELNQTKQYSLFLVIFSLAVGSFCIGTTEFVAMGLIQEIATDLHVSVPHAGYFISAYALGVMVGAPIIAILGAAFVGAKKIGVLKTSKSVESH